MGAWGPGIKQNDTFLDVYDTFIHYYNVVSIISCLMLRGEIWISYEIIHCS